MRGSAPKEVQRRRQPRTPGLLASSGDTRPSNEGPHFHIEAQIQPRPVMRIARYRHQREQLGLFVECPVIKPDALQNVEIALPQHTSLLELA
jgi:hypothetical protein